ncbi:MAG: transporter substrate-binding domain-containing protein [Desulfobacteraceae bacterium]|nr:transporter substrate-binding domain-containing protein [Desulfobacteraceae bacterium]
MKHFRYWILTLTLILFTGQLHARVNVTVYCDESYPPYSYQEKNRIKGIYTRILTRAFDRMTGYTVTIKAVPWKRGLNMLETGKGFAIYPPYFHPGKRPYMDYSVPILEERLTAFTTPRVTGQRGLSQWPRDFLGLRIGKNRGFVISKDPAYVLAVKAGTIQVEEAKGNRQNLLKLATGRIDVYVNDNHSILWELAKLRKCGIYDPAKGHLPIIKGPTISIQHGFLGFTNRNGGRFFYKKDFKQQLNTIIKSMQESGEIHRLVRETLAAISCPD